jgi:hypothetical protein
LTNRELISRWQLVPIDFSVDVAREPADRFQPLVALRHRWALSGPFHGCLRPDVRFVPLIRKAGEIFRV